MFDDPIARRTLFKLSAATAVTAVTPTWAKSADPRLPDVGSKFDPQGRVIRFAGNTVICHLAQQGPEATAFRALLDIYRTLPRYGFARKITLLPPSSYHMTLFGCANERQRLPNVWPASVPLDTPIEECTRRLAARFEGFDLRLARPIRMRVALDESPVDERPLKIRLRSADAVQERALRDARNRLSDHLGIRTPTHDAYEFHITLAYLFEALTATEHREFRLARTSWHRHLASAVPEIVLSTVEFCHFDDMFHFDRRREL